MWGIPLQPMGTLWRILCREG